MTIAAADDARAAAARAVTWLIIANKPFYPLYVWALAGHPGAACWALAPVPVYLALLAAGRRNALWLRAGLPAFGALDTAFEAKLLGAASGAELFYAPCLLLAALGFRPGERTAQRLALAAIAALALGLHGRLGAAWGPWSLAEAQGLFTMNLFAAAGLCAYTVWRFDPAGPARA